MGAVQNKILKVLIFFEGRMPKNKLRKKGESIKPSIFSAKKNRAKINKCG